MLYLSLSLELDSPRDKSPNNVYLFWLLTTFVLSFVLSSNNKNSFAGLQASRKCQLCTDYSGEKIQMTKFDSETTYLFGNENVANIFLTISNLYILTYLYAYLNWHRVVISEQCTKQNYILYSPPALDYKPLLNTNCKYE